MVKSVFFSVIFLFSAVSVVNSAERMVVGELFTSTTCGPCYNANLILNQIAEECSTFLAVIRYHTWWPNPGNDPFYWANPTENQIRTNLYQPGSKYVPRFFIDGIIDGGSNYSVWLSQIYGRSAQESPLRIVVTAQYEGEGRNARATAKIYNESGSELSGVLHFVLTETGIDYSAPNGLTEHHQVMLDMIPDANGEVVTIPANDSITKTRDFIIRDTTWLDYPNNTQAHLTVYESCQVVVFLQDQSTKEIYQGGKAWLTSGLGASEKPTVKTYRRELTAFPNPFTTVLNLNATNPGIKIYDVAGNLIKTLNRTRVALDAKDMEPGVYIIESGNSRLKVLRAK